MLADKGERLRRTVRHRLDLSQAHLTRVEASEWLRDPAGVLHRREQGLDEIHSRLRLACAQILHRARQRIHELEVRYTGAHPRLWSRQRERLDRLDHRLQWAASQRLRRLERALDACRQRILMHAPGSEITMLQDRLTQWQRHLERAEVALLRQHAQHVHALAARLESTSHRATLARGFTITRTRRGQIVTTPQTVKPGDRLITETAEGLFESRVTDARQGELFE
jgi:exodeoxyribonuclease VII large subunit